MPLHRNNDEERAAIVDRLLREYRHQHTAKPVKASLRTVEASYQGCHRRERRCGRSDVELRKQLRESECEWNVLHRRKG